MIDTLNIRLRREEAGNVDFLSETSCYLSNLGEHNYSGEIFITGEIDGLKVNLNKNQIRIKDGSLCKWYLGDNQQTMTRKDIERAIERLSNSLHLPINKAEVTRLDIAQNLSMRYPAEVYLSHLGELKNYKRVPMVQIGTLNYCRADGTLCFYDKVKELKTKREATADLYKGRNILRYELRYTKQIAKQLNTDEVRCCNLYDQDFYVSMLDKWKDTYLAIKKINDITLNWNQMRTKQDLYKMGILSLVDRIGGETPFFEHLAEAQKKGELTRQQTHVLREAVKEATKEKSDFVEKNEAVEELTEKVKQSVRFYR